MGNVAVTIIGRNVKGRRKEVTADFLLSASYATNGDSLLAADIASLLIESADLTKVTNADFEMGSDGTSLFLDRANKKIKAFSGRAEVANTTALNVTPGKIRGTLEYGDSPSSGV